MPSTRTIDRLTEDWPDSADRLEMQAFAAALYDERPQLSGPALDRIATLIAGAIDREMPQRVQPPGRLRRVGHSTAVLMRLFLPHAAAACLLIGGGAWMHQKMQSDRVVPQDGPDVLVNHKSEVPSHPATPAAQNLAPIQGG